MWQSWRYSFQILGISSNTPWFPLYHRSQTSLPASVATLSSLGEVLLCAILIMESRSRDNAPNCPIFGQPKHFDQRMLPTFGDVMRACLQKKYEKKTSKFEPKWTFIREEVIGEVLSIWRKASLPVVTVSRVRAMLDSFHSDYVC